MYENRLLVIGGVAAGLSAASRARKIDPRLSITVLEQGHDISYGSCGLPYLVAGQVCSPDQLTVYSADFFRQQRNIEVITGMRAVEIEPGRRRVRAADVETRQERPFHFDRLVIATGARPKWPQIPGIELPGVFQANNLEGGRKLLAFLAEGPRHPRRAIILGGGYIGLEYAEALRRRGLEVAVLEASEQILEGFDPEITEWVEALLAQHGVTLIKGASAAVILGDGAVARVKWHSPSGSAQTGAGDIDADLVLVATGLEPRAELALAAGLALGPAGSIAVDDRQLTSLPGLYAAGDCAQAWHLITGRPVYMPLGTTANKQGRVAGENAAGGRARFPGIVGTAAVRLFELECARTGLSENEAHAAGFRFVSATIEQASRASYLGGKPIRVKLLAERNSGRLLGGQMAGQEGVAKRIDVVATALHARMTAEQLAALDLTYAPPFAPVWDPVLVAAQALLRRL
jgi:NADPH-dependent 2,4-dienoyl-CoA reductase/sulfur reductase-like enzyme